MVQSSLEPPGMTDGQLEAGKGSDITRGKACPQRLSFFQDAVYLPLRASFPQPGSPAFSLLLRGFSSEKSMPGLELRERRYTH